jgi:hypothetical protein
MKADDSLMGTFGNLLRFLNNVMIEDGILLLQGCKAGGGDDGTKLLMQLSNALRPRKVVGFKTVGYQSVEKRKRGGDACREPGQETLLTIRSLNDPNGNMSGISKMGSGMTSRCFLGSRRLRPMPGSLKTESLFTENRITSAT